MVAMVAIDDRTRFASSHRQPEAREWISTCLRVHRRGIRVPQPTSDFFSEVSPRGWPWWPWWPSTIGRVQISDTAARANAWLWLGLGAHPKCLGARNAHNTPRQKSQEPALPIGAGQGKVELAACDRHESDASAGRSRAMRVATLAMVRGWWARKETRKSCKISKCPGLRRNTWQWPSLLGRLAAGTMPTRRPKGVLPIGTGHRVAH